MKPTPDIDPEEEVRRALEFFDKSEWDPEDEQREMQGNVDACCASAREWLRLREQPAPDVQAQIEAAVARERGRVIGIFVGELQKLHEKTVLDCGDNSCLFATRRGGMRTNGGCRCIERLLDAAVARERERTSELLATLRDLIADVEDLYPEIRARSGAKGE